MKEAKLKMNAKTFRRITIPILSLFLVVVLVLDLVAGFMGSTLDTYLGKGEVVRVETGGAGTWDTNYYPAFASTDEAKAAGYALAGEVMREGMVLLKNNGILPLAKGSTLTPFGKGYLEPIYGQLTSHGSAKWVVDPVSPEAALSTVYTINNAAVDRMKKAEAAALGEAAGTTTAGSTNVHMGGDSYLYEYEPSIYDGLTGADGTAMVMITRAGQEGSDKKYDGYADGTPHYLALSKNEQAAIRAAKENCGKLIVVLVSSAAIELSPLMSGELEADAIVWVGHPDEIGFAQLPGLLCGDIVPSGRTVDIYPADFTADPSYQNFGEFSYNNYTVTSVSVSDGGTFPGNYLEYQEGVYMGYRYYETAHDIDPDFVYGTLDGKGGVVTPGAVCYPFGYGLSYTSFSQKIVSFDDAGNSVTAEVEVTNTGSTYAGKEVVQLYVNPPYTRFDIDNRIEKPTASLVAFAKTGVIAPGACETVKLTFTKEDLASYCYLHANPDGTTGCYVLEEGGYEITLRANSHDILEARTVTVPATVWYDGSDEAHIRQTEKDAQSILDDEGNPTGEAMTGEFVAAHNLFQTSSDYMTSFSTILTRADWKGTFPKTAQGRTKALDPSIQSLMNYDLYFVAETDPIWGNVEGSLAYHADYPTSGAQNGLTLADMRGLSYDDPTWELYLDQIDWDGDKDGIIMNHIGASYALGVINSLGNPGATHADGANGLKVQGLDTSGYDMSKTSGYPFAPVQAATWNVELLYRVGNMMGREALVNGVSGWYSPAINLHRSPFSGRVFEYYSEDPLLSGKLAAACISGAGDAGMACYLKHFFLNDQETNRARLVSTWADEQTMRELYMRAFEIAFKEAKMTLKYIDLDKGVTTTKVMRAATAAMANQACIGELSGHASHALVNDLLRQEWGFRGMVITDYWVWKDNNLRDLCLRVGCDAYLSMCVPKMWTMADYDSPTSRWAMRNALHNISYTMANSGVNQGSQPGTTYKTTMSPWMKVLIAVNVVAVLVTALYVWRLLVRIRDEKAHPQRYTARKGK